MSNTPSSNQDAIALFESLHQLSQDILQASQTQDIAQLSQLVLRRNQTIDQVSKLELSQLSVETQQHLAEQLKQCQALDPLIQGQFSQIVSELDQQLKSCRENKTMLGHYKVPRDDDHSTRSNQA